MSPPVPTNQVSNPSAQYQGFPHLDSPLVQPDGIMAIPWYKFFIAQWKATGSGSLSAGEQVYLQFTATGQLNVMTAGQNTVVSAVLQPSAIPAGQGKLLGGTVQDGQAQVVGLSGSFTLGSVGGVETLALNAATTLVLGGLLASTGVSGQYVTGLGAAGVLQYGTPVDALTQGAVSATGTISIGNGLVLGSTSLSAVLVDVMTFVSPAGLAVANGLNPICLRLPRGISVTSVDYLIRTGSCTLAVQSGGAGLTGLTGITVNSATRATTTPTPVGVAAGADLTLNISGGAGGPAGLVVGVNFSWTS